MPASEIPVPIRVSIVIPARNEAPLIGRVVAAAFAQRPARDELDVIVVDDGSTDATGTHARAAGARVIPGTSGARGNPGKARNAGAAAAVGDPIVFLDADCVPQAGWLDALLAAHVRGAAIVGGSLAMPQGLGLAARCDYYCSCYHLHPARSAGAVPHHSPANLSVRRDVFRRTSGFATLQPVADGHEELGWQLAARQMGYPIFFEPQAIVEHHNDPGPVSVLRRSYRWGYSALQSKAESGLSRLAWAYRTPVLVLLSAIPASLAHAGYIAGCWLAAGRLEPMAMLPGIAVAQLAYAGGVMVGGVQWLRRRGPSAAEHRPRWR